MLRTIRAFWHDQRGIALVLVAIMLPAIIGFSLLVIDMSRANNLQSDLQKGADSFALATAAELDGRSDSITRGDRALATLVSNQYNFTTTPGPQGLAAAGVTRRYLRSIPTTVNGVPGDARAISAADVITNEVADAKLARFVEIRVTPVGFSTIFPVSLLPGGANNAWTIGAIAVAGFSTSVCDYTPVFICNPYEKTEEAGGLTLEQAATNRDQRRRQLILRGDKFYGPGNFSFLDSPLGTGAKALEQAMARVKPAACFGQNGVNTKPGQNAGPVLDGLNARFGLTSTYIPSDPPSQNVRMGAKDVVCKSGAVKSLGFNTAAEGTTGLTRDSCYPNNCTPLDPTHPTDAGSLGDGNWNPGAYWAANHILPGSSPPVARPFPSGPDIPWTASGVNAATRYEIYRYEIDHGMIADKSTSGDTGTPLCGEAPISIPDRRILYGAILDCDELALNGNQNDVPVRAFGSFFITEPIKSGKEIYVELVDITGKGGRGTLDNFLRDEAQLYR
ncbi:pilus assembly protein [Mesorhizobium sp. B2-7-3]|uniref:TadE/TadG family type IV pilus assembly protein n=1 Tax=unclassified Mesorhizobium TaxID=325217 RepID=UPI00112B9B20|nr:MULTISPECIES: TadE/TadG family type IV pilus assembly protein [unclassified Mesorhizobium]MBZ9682362.1 pilus assembly protein [Mesorhizobium sp. CO1-1-2]MBZ9925652.1 pilus assembly protein [Mesorhizobium sp. BR1-1-4]TPJ15281.1 pilus assembly protein [Mesorhizobium sp. B2-7-3]